MPKPRNILLMPFGSIGDAVMMCALCVEIRAHEPNTTFTLLARRNAKLIADLAAQYPYLKVVHISLSPIGMGKLLWQLLQQPYAALMPGAFSKGSLPATVFAILRLRPGSRTYGLLKNKADADAFTESMLYDSAALHMDNLRKLARAAGFTVEKEGTPIAFEFNSQMPKDFPFASKGYIVLHPFGSSSRKSFPPRKSREVLLELSKRYPSLGLVVTGGKENAAEAKQIVDDIPNAMIAAGMPILEAIGVIGHAAVFIGVDTGTMHLASLIGQKVVALEHNASPEWWPTYNPNATILTNKEHCICQGSKNDDCVVWEGGKPYMRCLYEIPNESILESIAEKLQ